VTLPPHLTGAFCLVPQSRSYGYAPSLQDKNLSAICILSINKYWGTGSKSEAKIDRVTQTGHPVFY
ncbi:MAG: hypothetical protein K2H61_00255, partial [Muribaculaceae bacterium]|nr:hypothetical protein [Muribaculaceae bacterium]